MKNKAFWWTFNLFSVLTYSVFAGVIVFYVTVMFIKPNWETDYLKRSSSVNTFEAEKTKLKETNSSAIAPLLIALSFYLSYRLRLLFLSLEKKCVHCHIVCNRFYMVPYRSLYHPFEVDWFCINCWEGWK